MNVTVRGVRAGAVAVLVALSCAVCAIMSLPVTAHAASPIAVGTTVSVTAREVPGSFDSVHVFYVNNDWACCLQHWVNTALGSGQTVDLLGTPHTGRKPNDDTKTWYGLSHPWTQADIDRCAVAEKVVRDRFGTTDQAFAAWQGYVWHVDAGDWGEGDDTIVSSFTINHVTPAASIDQVDAWVRDELPKYTGHAVRIYTREGSQDVGVFWVSDRTSPVRLVKRTTMPL